jgi:hypothetical protein
LFYFSIYFTYFEKSNLERMHAGQEDRQEEEDEREELQPEPLLERVIRLHHRRDGHEAGHPGNDGRAMMRVTF